MKKSWIWIMFVAIGVTGVAIGAILASLKVAPLTPPVARETKVKVETETRAKVEDNMVIIPPKVVIITVAPALPPPVVILGPEPKPIVPALPPPVVILGPEPKPIVPALPPLVVILGPEPKPIVPALPAVPIPELEHRPAPLPIPVVETKNIIEVSRDSAVLLAFVDTKGWGFQIWWEYGYTQDLGVKTLESFVMNLPPGLVQKQLRGLRSGTIYFYRVSVRMVDGQVHNGSTRSFMTDS